MNTTIKAIALVAVIAAAAVALSANGSDAVTYTDDSGIIYEASGTTATVIGWEGASSELTIPSKITVDGKDYNVTKIGDRAFYGQDIKTIVLPDTLRTLGADAFSCNDVVETVEIPGSVDSYAHSFSGCSSLKEIRVAASNDTFESVSGVLMNEKKDTIYQYPAGKTTYTIPDSVKTIGAFAWGDQPLYDYLAENTSVCLRRAAWVNDPFNIAQNDNMVSINSCIEVDLTGQVNSETIGLKQFSGTGGQFDYVKGASWSKGGRSIMAMPSTAAHGKASRIVPFLSPGAAVTTPRDDVDYVVTEYGVAHLKGASLKERAKRLIAIAHPDFRPMLEEEYKKRFKN